MKNYFAAFIVAVLITIPARAHFIWIVPGEKGATVVFSEDLRPDEDVPVDSIAATKLFMRDTAGKAAPLSWEKAPHAYAVTLANQDVNTVGGVCRYGVRQRSEGKPYLLAYYPKWVRGDVKNAKPWSELPLEIVHQNANQFRVLFEGKPAADAEVVVLAQGDAKMEKQKTNLKGEFTLESAVEGLRGIRARHIEAKSGEEGGKKYEEVRHFATLVFQQEKEPSVGATSAAKPASSSVSLAGKEGPLPYPPLPRAVSSLGAVAVDGWAYVYGGHSGRAHEYSTEIVLGTFHRLHMAEPKAWEELPSGPAVQGLALVAYQGKVYRIGGMQARNKPDEKEDNHSITSCTCYDPATNRWQPLPELPEARSSHDAVVIGDRIMVVGGWKMNGAGKKPDWHRTALILDLKKHPLGWEVVPQPFERRALTVASHAGKVFVLAGMADEGEMALTVNIYDPAQAVWSTGPAIPGPQRNGFSPAACTTGGDLYVSTGDGKISRLTTKGDGWEEVGALKQPRIVHRLLPVSEHWLMALGGSADGNAIASVEVVPVTSRSAKKQEQAAP